MSTPSPPVYNNNRPPNQKANNMANIGYGGGIVDARGSIGGTTLSRGAGGAIARARVKPINPRSSRQNDRRSTASLLMTRWSTSLSVIQRAAWTDFAAASPTTNKLGQSIYLSGIACYVRLNSLRVLAAQAIQDQAPVMNGAAGGITLVAQGVVAGSLVGLTDAPVGFGNDVDDELCILFAGAPRNPGKAAISSAFRYIGTIAGQVAVPPSYPQTFASPWTLITGQLLTIKGIRQDATYRISPDAFDDCIITAS